MKPKLVLLNGPCGIGKSTIAQRYVDEHPLALNLDMDNVWAMLGRWRVEKERSTEQKLRLAYAMAETQLRNGYDVVVPNILYADTLQAFDALAGRCGAEVNEFALLVSKDEAIRRFIKRGQAGGLPTGFRPGGVLETSGGVKKLEEMYDSLQATLADRPDCVVIEPMYGEPAATYAQLTPYLS